MVDSVRIAEKALGKVNYELTEKETARPCIPAFAVYCQGCPARRNFNRGKCALDTSRRWIVNALPETGYRVHRGKGYRKRNSIILGLYFGEIKYFKPEQGEQ